MLWVLLALAFREAPASPVSDLAGQRSNFLAAERAFARGRTAEYTRLKAGLAEYPLYPYLEYQELRQRVSTLAGRQVRRFLDTYGDTPLADSLRRHWLDELGRREDWQSYLTFYEAGSSTKRACLYLQALLQTGRSSEALDQVPQVWLSGSSRPKSCDPVFDSWRKAGRLTPALVWQRIELAMGKRNIKLASYLGRYLPEKDKPWLDLWLEINRFPERIQVSGSFSQAHPLRERILVFGVERLAREDPLRAVSVWQDLGQRYPFDEHQRYRVQRALALSMARHEVPDLLDRLDVFTPNEDDELLHERRIREALARQAWSHALAWIEALPPALATRENWRYWRARALEQSGRSEESISLYRDLAKERSYHGFLAADRVGSPYNLDHQPLSVPGDILGQLASRGGFSRARELVVLGRLISARREWRIATESLSLAELQAAAKLAQDWGWHSQAIFTLAKTGYWEDLELRFPLDHQRDIDKAAHKQQLDKAWILAVIRQESAFSTDAVSRAGARGLMQLMPATARETARQMKRRSPSKGDLLTPATNIDIGTAYLKIVYEQLYDNTVLAISAYNAGPHRVSRWLPEKSLEADIWIETIPFRETRRYTKRVLAYSVIYDNRLGKEVAKITSRMPSVLPRKELIAKSEGKKSAASEDNAAL